MKNSLLKTHLDILNGDSGLEQANIEQSRAHSIQIKPLRIEGRQRRLPRLSFSFSWVLLPVATMSGALLFLRTNENQDVVRLKGHSQIWLYWERDGVVNPGQPSEGLLEGDRVRAEILSPQNAHATWFVTNKDGDILSDVKSVQNDELSLNRGERKVFPGSFRLVGENQNEHLVVSLCTSSVSTDTLLKASKALFRQGDAELINGSCVLRKFGLRKESK